MPNRTGFSRTAASMGKERGFAMGAPKSATATTDPREVGAAATRTLALELSGQLGKKKVVFPGALVTQAFLLENKVKNMSDLRAKLPALNLANVSSASWLRSVSF